MNIAGFYINLDRSAARRRHVDAQIARLGLRNYSRLSAIDGAALPARASALKPGEIGCYRSHLNALEAAHAAGGAAHVLEDDALLSPLVAQCAPMLEAAFKQFDVVFTETFVQFEVMDLKFYKQRFDAAHANYLQGRGDFDILDIGRRPFAIASSYFVSPEALPNLVTALRSEWDAGPRVPYDLMLSQLATSGALRAGCVFPFISSVRLENIFDTTIAQRPGQVGNPTAMASALLRYIFFIDADLGAYITPFLKQIGAASAPAGGDARLDVILKILAFVLSDRYEPF